MRARIPRKIAKAAVSRLDSWLLPLWGRLPGRSAAETQAGQGAVRGVVAIGPGDGIPYAGYGFGEKGFARVCEPLRIRPGSPGVTSVADAVYLPCASALEESGLYDTHGELMEGTRLWRGPDGRESVTRNMFGKGKGYSYDIEERPVVYLGPLVDHYGHFLTECCARVWAVMGDAFSEAKLVFHGDGRCLQREYVRSFFRSIGLDTARFTAYSRPTLIREAIVPKPSMINRCEVWGAHVEMMATAADNLLGMRRSGRNGRPVYLSRARLDPTHRALWREDRLLGELRKRGFKVIYPETMSLAEQVAVFNAHETYVGPLGSAFHNTLFSREPCMNVYLAGDLGENYLLFDACKGNASVWIRCVDALFSFKPGVRKNMRLDCQAALAGLEKHGVA